jgi:hypothetical protein
MFYVYAHYKKTDNSLFYIGVAKSVKRFTSIYSRNNLWKNIVNKNGFYYKILFEFDCFNKCFEKEKELIKKHGRIDLKTGILCNMTDGGEGCLNLSSASKDKISKSNKGKKRSDLVKENMRKRMVGKKLSITTIKKMSESHKKIDKSYLFNRVFSEQHKNNISKSKKGKSVGVGKILTEEHKKAISKGFKPKFNDDELKKIIEMYNKNISLRKIALKFNSNHTTIKKYIKQEIENL